MSQTLLFSIGVGVFAITVVATLLYAYLALDRIHQADAAERPVIEPTLPTTAAVTGALSASLPVVRSTPL